MTIIDSQVHAYAAAAWPFATKIWPRGRTVLPSIAVSRQLIDGSLRAYRIVTPRITRQLVVIHLPGQPMSVAATKLVEIRRQELADASAQLQNPPD